MHHALALAATVFFGTAACEASTMDDAITSEMADRIGRKVAPATVKIVSPLTLAMSRDGQEATTINLDRVAEFCRSNEKDDCESIKLQFVASASDADANPAVSRSNLRLVVRASEYVAGIISMFADKPGSVPVTDTFVPGISLVLMVDFPTTARAVNADDLRALKLTRDEAWALGRQQLTEHLPALPTATALSKGLVAITDIDYAASILLVDGWDALSKAVGPGLFVAVPDDNFALIGIEDDITRTAKIKKLVRDHYGRAQRGVSPLVYRRLESKWVPVG